MLSSVLQQRARGAGQHRPLVESARTDNCKPRHRRNAGSEDGGEAPLVRRGLTVDGVDRYLDGLATDGHIDLDLCIHPVVAAVAAANDRKAHRGTSRLGWSRASHSLSFD